jgi:methyl-accepting chemotaxis protein
VDDLDAEIAAASGEQNQGIGQINMATTQMDSVTQRNAASAEESASASEELSSQAAALTDTVGELLQLVGGTSHTPAPAKSSHAAQAHTPKPVARTKTPALPKASAKTVKPAARPLPADVDIPMESSNFANF